MPPTPARLSTTTYASSNTGLTSIFAAPMPPPALPVFHGSLLSESLADSAEMRDTRRSEEN